jgi:hypothetical protein
MRSKEEVSLSAVSILFPSPVPAIADIGQQPAGHPLCSGECLGPADGPSSNCRASARPSHRPGRAPIRAAPVGTPFGANDARKDAGRPSGLDSLGTTNMSLVPLQLGV